jgi:tetratricopeptide (TPR) repeat protein
MTVRLKSLGLLALCALLGGTGCGRDSYAVSAETDEPFFREGQDLNRQGRTQEAMAAYLKVIAERGDQAPESHLEVGLIYLEHIHDPIEAIYYFRKYLELEPNSRQAGLVRGLVDTAKRDFARTLPGQPLDNQTARLDEGGQIETLQRENEDLRAEVAALRAGEPAPAPHVAGDGSATDGQSVAPMFVPPPAPVPTSQADDQSPIKPAPMESDTSLGPADSAAPAATPAPDASQQPAAARTHAVERGDTLYSLSLKYYGSRSKWRDILAANRDQLPAASTPLKIGMELRIP